jgi:hypothetical protein
MSTHKERLAMVRRLLKTLSTTDLEHNSGHHSGMNKLAYLDFTTLKTKLPKDKDNPDNQ